MSNLGKQDEDSIAFLVEMDEDELRVRLTLYSGTKLNAKEFLSALSIFVDDYKDNPDELFNECIDMDDDRH